MLNVHPRFHYIMREHISFEPDHSVIVPLGSVSHRRSPGSAWIPLSRSWASVPQQDRPTPHPPPRDGQAGSQHIEKNVLSWASLETFPSPPQEQSQKTTPFFCPGCQLVCGAPVPSPALYPNQNCWVRAYKFLSVGISIAHTLCLIHETCSDF